MSGEQGGGTPPHLQLEHLTSPEVRAAIDAGYTTAVIGCGAVEQHGPHLPLFMDAEHGTRLAEEVARRIGNALVTPTIRVGCSEHHMGFAGSLSLRVETFQAVCQDYATSLARHGFRTIYFVPTHGGNFQPLAELVPRLREDFGDEVRVAAFTDLTGLVERWRAVVQEASGLGDRVGGHADIVEASIMLVLRPELVRTEKAAPGYLAPLTPALLARMYEDGIHAVTPNGILGDPRGMSEELGRICIEAAADRMAAYFKEHG